MSDNSAVKRLNNWAGGPHHVKYLKRDRDWVVTVSKLGNVEFEQTVADPSLEAAAQQLVDLLTEVGEDVPAA